MAKIKTPAAAATPETKPAARTRKPKPPAPSLAQSAYLQNVMADPPPAQALQPIPTAALEGEVFPPLPEAHAPRTADEFLLRISELWEDAQQRFLRIGELMTLAETRLNDDERAILYEGLNRRFGKSARSQLMSAYRAIRDQIVPLEMAAAGYGTVYMLARLSDEQRSRAATEGLLRPDVRQAEIRNFFQTVRAPMNQETRIAELEAREAKLLAELAKVRDALARERGAV